ncbi:trichohyalin-like [Notolabrus celidotus]|uniref:trichohyalin-like n=1 Tax=Notolabrus celidotus TaxID=1203425 RepID=UPI0014908875|nr:trichohyalin-like [Notolabrus celidotus]
MKKITKKGKNRKTAVPVLQVWTEEADALRTHMKPADLEDEEDAIIPVWQLGVKVVQQVDTEEFPALQKEPLKRQSLLQEPKADSVGSSQVQVQVQIPEPECQIEQPALEMEKEEPRETDEAQQTEVIRLQAELSRMCMALQNQSLLWGNDRAILLGENATLRDALYHANLALENQKRQCTEDRSSLHAEVITPPDFQTQVSNQQETAEVAVPEIVKEEPSVTEEHPAQQTEVTRLQAELSRVSIALHNQSLLWGYDRAVLLKENSRLRDALYHANMAVEMMRRQCTEDRPSLQAVVTTNKDHQREEKDSPLLAETLKENATMKAALIQAKEELQNKSREWEEERSFLLLVNDETIKLQDALCQAQEDLKRQKQQWDDDKSHVPSAEKETSMLKAALYQAQEELRKQQQQWNQDKSRLLKEQKETTSKLEADLRQAKIKTQCSLDSEERTKLLFRDMAQKAKLNQEQWEEDRSRLLAEREVETTMMQQAKMDLHTQKCEWEKERAQFLAEQKEALKIKTALNKAQEELKEQKLQWEQEKASFRETLTVINESLEDEEKDRNKTENTLMDRLRNLETQVEEARKPPKKSFKKKFLNFFKRDARTPSPTSDTLIQDPSTTHS